MQRFDFYFHFGGTKWVADKEREIYLICLCGQGDTFDQERPPYYYRLIIQGIPIEIWARYEWTGTSKTGFDYRWEIELIDDHSINFNMSKETFRDIELINDEFINLNMSKETFRNIIIDAFTKDITKYTEWRVLSVSFEIPSRFYD